MPLFPIRINASTPQYVNSPFVLKLSSKDIMNAHDSSYNFFQNSSVNTVYMNVVDTESSDITYTILTLPSNGDLFEIGNDAPITLPITIDSSSVHYTPSTGFTGTDSFTFKATDDRDFTSNVATNYINIYNIVAYDNSYSIVKNMNNITVDMSANDGDGDPITYKITSLPTNGLLTKTNGDTIIVDNIIDISSVNYTPNYNFIGLDSFTFNASDGTNTSNTATTSINVTDPSVNNLLIWRNYNDTTDINLAWNMVYNNSNDYDFGCEYRTGDVSNNWTKWSIADASFVSSDFVNNAVNHVKVNMQRTSGQSYDTRLVVFQKGTLNVVQRLESILPAKIYLKKSSGNWSGRESGTEGWWYRDFGLYTSSGKPFWNGSQWTNSQQTPAQSIWDAVDSPNQIPGGYGMLVSSYSKGGLYNGDTYWYFLYGMANNSGERMWSVSQLKPGWDGQPTLNHVYDRAMIRTWMDSSIEYYRVWRLHNTASVPSSIVGNSTPIPEPEGTGTGGLPGIRSDMTIDFYFGSTAEYSVEYWQTNWQHQCYVKLYKILPA